MDESQLASEIAAEMDLELKTVQNALTKAAAHPTSGISRIGPGTKNAPYRSILEDAALAS